MNESTMPLVAKKWLLTGLVASQVLYALLKKTVPAGLPYVPQRNGLVLTKSEIGSIYSSFAVAYGASKLVGGQSFRFT